MARVDDLDVTDENVKNPAEDAVFTGGSIYLPQVRRKAEDRDHVADGDTAVIGGMMSNQVSESESRVPVLGSIPVPAACFDAQMRPLSSAI